MNRFIFGDVFYHGSLNDKQRKLITLVALQLLYFYISQFLAITATLLQLAALQVLFAYRRWYFGGGF